MLAVFSLLSICEWWLFLTHHRDCTPGWAVLPPGATGVSIALVSLAATTSRVSELQGGVNGTSTEPTFNDVMRLSKANKVQYAQRHGYTFIDASDLLDASRPASWSKIVAVKHYLQEFEWVFWVDADTVITNSSIKVESLLPAEHYPDFIVTKDAANYNAGEP